MIGSGYGQYLENPSLEGIPGIGLIPSGWAVEDPFSTPDTGPLPCEELSAAEGSTYLVLVTRGEGADYPGTGERIYAPLEPPLEEGRYYRLTLQLASRDEVGHFSWEEGFIPYTAPIRLRVHGSVSGADNAQLLGETRDVHHSAWGAHSVILIPQSDYPFLVLEVSSPSGWGNLLLDDLRIEELEELPLDAGELMPPNVFTPNGDGFNDRLVIPGLRSGSSLRVFDRSGRQVFFSSDYQHDWRGTDPQGRDLPEGTYWYILLPSHLDEVRKGFLYLKREP